MIGLRMVSCTRCLSIHFKVHLQVSSCALWQAKAASSTS